MRGNELRISSFHLLHRLFVQGVFWVSKTKFLISMSSMEIALFSDEKSSFMMFLDENIIKSSPISFLAARIPRHLDLISSGIFLEIFLAIR